MNIGIKPILTLVLLSLNLNGMAAENPHEMGRWITESGNLEVEIAPCADAICGTVIRVLANHSMRRTGQSMQAVDKRSPLGMQILTGFHKRGGGAWQGKIYNRENAQIYDCVIELIATDQLKVRPYKVIPLFGKTQVWHRVSGVAP